MKRNDDNKQDQSPLINWLEQPEAHDYPAAVSYLSLLMDANHAQQLVQALQQTPVVEFKAKDIFRASGLSLLGISNSHVEHDRNKIAQGKCLSPLLLVRDTTLRQVIIADGYHRLCALYGFDEDALVPCQIISL